MSSLAVFPDSMASTASLLMKLPVRSHPVEDVCLTASSGCFLRQAFPSACLPSLLCRRFDRALKRGAEISICCPSSTLFSLNLGPALPWADQPSPGTLGLSVYMILACMSLLMPAFSLLSCPLHFTMQLLPANYAPLPIACAIPRLRRHA